MRRPEVAKSPVNSFQTKAYRSRAEGFPYRTAVFI